MRISMSYVYRMVIISFFEYVVNSMDDMREREKTQCFHVLVFDFIKHIPESLILKFYKLWQRVYCEKLYDEMGP